MTTTQVHVKLDASSQHRNKHPFSGVMTFFDVKSDRPVGGAKGKLVLIPSSVGVPALASLEGMAVNVSGAKDRHAPTQKVGIIEKAWVGVPLDDGAVPVHVEGYLFRKDFPDLVNELHAESDDLGFSYECDAALTDRGDHFEATSLEFSGATMIYKSKAAYKRTTLAAEGDDMNEEQLKAMLEAMGIDGAKLSTVLNAWDEFKKQFEGEGKYASLHVSLNAAAEKIEELTQKVASLETALTEAKTALTASADAPVVKVEDFDALKASYDAMKAKFDEREVALQAEADEKERFARKSVAFPATLLSKYRLEATGDLKEQLASVDKRSDLEPHERMALKMEIRESFKDAQ